jgi:hypothetical protein
MGPLPLIALIISGVAGPTDGHAPARPNAIGVSLNGATRNQRDENFNDTRYAAGLGHLGLHYTRVGAQNRHEVALAGGAGVGQNRYDRSVLFIDLRLRYAFQHDLTLGRVRFALGGVAAGGPTLYQFREEDADHINWWTIYDAAIRGAVHWDPNDRRGRQHRLEASLELPVVGVVSRPPESVTHNNDKPSFGYLFARAHRKPRAASWHNVQSVRPAIRWSFRITDLIEQHVSYSADFTRVAFPNPVVAWTHVLSYRIDFRVGR